MEKSKYSDFFPLFNQNCALRAFSSPFLSRITYIISMGQPVQKNPCLPEVSFGLVLCLYPPPT